MGISIFLDFVNRLMLIVVSFLGKQGTCFNKRPVEEVYII